MPVKRFKVVPIGLFFAFLAVGCAVNASAHTVSGPTPIIDAPLAKNSERASIVLAGGCFWGMQDVFEHVRGVRQVIAGYAGGSADTAHYEKVGSGLTGHAESVQIIYNPSVISIGKILQIYFSVAHDPTQRDGQGPDRGPQYRSSIFFDTVEQQKIAEAYIAQMSAAKIFSSPIVTTIVPLQGFFPAEAYHQDYAKRNPYNPYISINDTPKIKALEKYFPPFYVP